MTNAWQITPALMAAAGYSQTGSGQLILLTESGDAKLVGIGVRGAPGPARIVAVRGEYIVVGQGYGFVVYNYVTGERFPCGRRKG